MIPQQMTTLAATTDEDEYDAQHDEEHAATLESPPNNPMAVGQRRTPPRRVPHQQRRTVEQIVQELKDWWVAFERALAGYMSLNKALQSFKGQLPPDERLKGLPVFQFVGTADGRTQVQVAADVKVLARANPQYVDNVLIPFINVYGAQIVDALHQVEIRTEELRNVFNPQPPQPQVG